MTAHYDKKTNGKGRSNSSDNPYSKSVLSIPGRDACPHLWDPNDGEERCKLVETLFRAGHRLQYSPETTSTAILLFHRFLLPHNLGKGNATWPEMRVKVVLVTCLFLAGKARENPRRLRDVINVIRLLMDDKGAVGFPPPHPTTRFRGLEVPRLNSTYMELKKRVVECEQVLLRSVGFNLDMVHPYRLLLNYCRSLRLSERTTQVAWGILNDFLFIPFALALPPPVLTCAALHMASIVVRDEHALSHVSKVWYIPKTKRWEPTESPIESSLVSMNNHYCAFCLVPLFTAGRKRMELSF